MSRPHMSEVSDAELLQAIKATEEDFALLEDWWNNQTTKAERIAVGRQIMALCVFPVPIMRTMGFFAKHTYLRLMNDYEKKERATRH